MVRPLLMVTQALSAVAATISATAGQQFGRSAAAPGTCGETFNSLTELTLHMASCCHNPESEEGKAQIERLREQAKEQAAARERERIAQEQAAAEAAADAERRRQEEEEAEEEARRVAEEDRKRIEAEQAAARIAAESGAAEDNSLSSGSGEDDLAAAVALSMRSGTDAQVAANVSDSAQNESNSATNGLSVLQGMISKSSTPCLNSCNRK